VTVAPLVSVVLPVWNRERYVEAAARSVLGQTLGDLELIAVDDGSTDASRAILERLAACDPRLRVVAAPHEGQSAAINRGLALVRGRRVAFQDSDDLWRPAALERLEAALAAAPDRVGLVYGRYRLFPDGAEPDDPGAWLPFAPRAREGDVHASLLRGNFVSRITALIRREALEAVGARLSATWASDWDLLLRLAERYHFRHVPEVVALVRFHAENMSHDVLAHHRSFLEVLEAARARAGSEAEARRRGVLAALARQHLASGRHLLEAGRTAEARTALRTALPEASRRERLLAWALLGVARLPGGPRLFGAAHQAALRASGRVPWGPPPAPPP